MNLEIIFDIALSSRPTGQAPWYESNQPVSGVDARANARHFHNAELASALVSVLN